MRPGRLVYKIYFGGILTFVVSGLLFYVLLRSTRTNRQSDMAHLSRYVLAEVAPLRHRPERLSEVQWLRQGSTISVAIYEPGGKLLLSAGKLALPMIAADEVERLEKTDILHLRGEVFVHAIREEGRLAAIGIVSMVPPQGDRFIAPNLALLILLLGVAVISSRHLALPLQRIASAAKRFGRGELTARADVRRNDEIGDVGRSFDEMADRVTRLISAQQELMANVSHELQTPISRIQIALDLISVEGLERAKDLLPEIAIDLAELERLISDIMTVARLELSRVHEQAARTPMRSELASAAQLLEKAVARFRSQHASHPVRLELQPALPVISADTVLLRRAIENLLDNARKYSEPGSTIRVSAETSASRLLIKVTDSGIGIDAGDLKLVSTPFFRSDRSRSRATGGFGLGLALARRVVEAHGGTIEIESTPGQGTTVTLSLPLPPPEIDS